jgi:hypothetical protein
MTSMEWYDIYRSEKLRSCLKSLHAEGGDGQTWGGKFLLLYIHPSLCKSSNWDSTPSWETNASDITLVSSSVHDCSKIHLASSLIHVAYQCMMQETWGQGIHWSGLWYYPQDLSLPALEERDSDCSDSDASARWISTIYCTLMLLVISRKPLM